MAEKDWSLEKWSELLKGCAPRIETPTLGALHPTSDVEQLPVHKESFPISAVIVDKIRDFSASKKISPFVVGLHLLFKTLAHFRASDEDSFCVGVPYDVRPPSFQSCMGMFVNTVLVPSPTTCCDSVERERDIATLNETWVRDILPIARTPYDLLVQKGFGCNVMLTFNVGLNISGAAASKEDGVTVEALNSSSGTSAKFDLTVAFEDDSAQQAGGEDGGWRMIVESGVGPVWQGLGETLLWELQQLLGSSEGGSQFPLARLPVPPVSSPADHEDKTPHPLVLDRSAPYYGTVAPSTTNNFPELFPADYTLPTNSPPYYPDVMRFAHGPQQFISDHLLAHEIFENVVKKHPNNAALRFSSQTLTYAELDARANRVANSLRDGSFKVGPNVFVGLLIDRSIEMMVGLLGILKAGGAYVPLDPSYPVERLEYMVQDSGVQSVVGGRNRSGVVGAGIGFKLFSLVCLLCGW